MKKNIICDTKNFYIFLAFLLITIALWIAVSIYCYLIKYRAKKTLIPILRHKYRSSRPEVFLEKRVLKTCSKFIGEHPWQSVISIKLQSNFIEITLWHG